MPEDYHAELAMGPTGVTGGLKTLFVVFFNGNVFSRHNKLYDLTTGMDENCLCVASMVELEVPNKNVSRKMIRMLLASCFLTFSRPPR